MVPHDVVSHGHLALTRALCLSLDDRFARLDSDAGKMSHIKPS